jgi:hypothetical protein
MSQLEARLDEIATALGEVKSFEAVALAGSRVASGGDARSDVDLYVYAREPVSLDQRAVIANCFADRVEVGNTFWESGDEWIDRQTGLQFDIMYRSPGWIEDQLDRVLLRHEASIGYSTCFWHNVLHSRPLYDPLGWYRALQTWADRPYPQALQQAIIARNHPILRQTLSSYSRQIVRAVARGDSVSVQHRLTAILASYFDILFALNALPHPGEKSLLRIASARCAKQPPGMVSEVEGLLAMAAFPADARVLGRVTTLLDGLDALLVQEGWLPAIG